MNAQGSQPWGSGWYGLCECLYVEQGHGASVPRAGRLGHAWNVLPQLLEHSRGSWEGRGRPRLVLPAHLGLPQSLHGKEEGLTALWSSRVPRVLASILSACELTSALLHSSYLLLPDGP